MKKYLLFCTFLCIGFYSRARESIKVAPRNFNTIKVVLVCLGKEPELKECASIIRRDFLASRQLDVSTEYFKTAPQKKVFNHWAKQGKMVAIFLNMSEGGKTFEWRIYDTSKIAMLKGKKYKKRGSHVRGWAHNIADMIWPEIMGQEGCFSTKIAFCKEIKQRGKQKNYLHIYIADYDGSNQEPLVATPTINIAPRWNRDVQNPLLFYSESSKANVCLRVVDMQGRRRVASNFDGLNMLPAFSKDGKKVVYCMSHGHGTSHLYSYENGELKKLTHNSGNNISPTLSEDGERIYFCSDFKRGMPLIFCYNCVNGKLEQITDKGPCFSPSYCERNNKLAYVRRVDGIMQIFVYDLNTRKHTQLTSDPLHKEECIWSVCGNYLLFCLTTKNSSRLAMEHVVTRQRRVLTPSGQFCSYPSWSIRYDVFPVI